MGDFQNEQIANLFQDFFETDSNIIINHNAKFLLTKGYDNIVHKDRQIQYVFKIYPDICDTLIENVYNLLKENDEKEITTDEMYGIFRLGNNRRKKKIEHVESIKSLYIVIFYDNATFMRHLQNSDISGNATPIAQYDIIFLGDEIKETILRYCFLNTGKRILNIRNATTRQSPVLELFSENGYMSQLLKQIKYKHRETFRQAAPCHIDPHHIEITSIYLNEELIHFPPSRAKFTLFTLSRKYYTNAMRLLNFSNNINQLNSRKTPNELFKEYKIETSFLKKIIAYNGAHITNENELDFPSTTFIENLKLCLPSFGGMTYNTFRSPLQSFLDTDCSFYSILSNATHHQGDNRKINQGEKIEYIMDDVHNKVCGIFVNNQYIRAKYIIGNHSFFPETTKEIIGKIMHGIFFCDSFALDHSKKNFFEIIVPETEISIDHSNAIYIYIFRINFHNNSKYKGYVFTKCETDENEGIKNSILTIVETVCQPVNFKIEKSWVDDIVQPTNNPLYDQCYILGSLDETCGYRNMMKDVLQIYQQIEGKPYNFN